MSAIEPGDWVEFIGRDETLKQAHRVEGQLAVGQIYRVRALMRGYDRNANTWMEGLQLFGVYAYHENGVEGAWHPSLFRPIYRPKSSLIQTLKQPAPDAVRKLEDA